MSNVRNRRRGEGQRNMVAALIRLGTGRAGLLGLRPAPQRRTGLGLHNVAVPTERSCLRANALQEGFLCHSRRRRRTIADARFQFLSVLGLGGARRVRSEEHTSELQSLMRISYAVFCLKKNINPTSCSH